MAPTLSLTPDLLMQCTGCTSLLAEKYVENFNEVLPLYDLQTARRAGMFLANIGHESMQLRFLTELWGDPPTPEQQRYESRQDLGNLYLGDGFKYRGRGWLETTGRSNYLALTLRLKQRWPNLQVPDFVAYPDLLSQPQWATLSAADYWDMRHLSVLADAGDFDGVCDIINLGHRTPNVVGSSNGWAKRLALWQSARPSLILAGFPT